LSTYLSEEPEYFEWPEDGVDVEHERVRVRSICSWNEVSHYFN